MIFKKINPIFQNPQYFDWEKHIICSIPNVFHLFRILAMVQGQQDDCEPQNKICSKHFYFSVFFHLSPFNDLLGQPSDTGVVRGWVSQFPAQTFAPRASAQRTSMALYDSPLINSSSCYCNQNFLSSRIIRNGSAVLRKMSQLHNLPMYQNIPRYMSKKSDTHELF